MKIFTKLPSEIHSFEYVKNSHFIKLKDDNDSSITMFAKSFMQYYCSNCSQRFWMESNVAVNCPVCGFRGKLSKQWKYLQLGFMPEEESDFIPPKQK